MRVLHILAPAPVGGLESVVQMLLPGLKRLGVDVSATAVVGRTPSEPAIIGSLRQSGVEVHVLQSSGRDYLDQWRAHRARVRQWQPDVVHTHGYLTDVIAGSAVRGLVARVSTAHGFTGGGRKNQLYERLQLRVLRNFDTVIAVSSGVGQRLIRSGVRSERVLQLANAWGGRASPINGAAARAELGLPAEGRVIGWVGRLSREKGADVLLASLPHLTTPVTIAIIGDGPEREALRAQATALGLDDRVRFLGMIPDAIRLNAAFDLFVLSSRTEGTPIALFEAMAAGVPVVATAVGGVPDVLQEAHGRLVPPAQPVELAKAIDLALAQPEESLARARSASERLATTYALDPWLGRHVTLYQQLAQRRSRT